MVRGFSLTAAGCTLELLLRMWGFVYYVVDVRPNCLVNVSRNIWGHVSAARFASEVNAACREGQLLTVAFSCHFLLVQAFQDSVASCTSLFSGGLAL